MNEYAYYCKSCADELSSVWRCKIKSLHERGELDVPEQKKCFRCKKIKHRSEFYRDRSKVDGLMTYCSKCAGELVKERRKKRGFKA